MSTITPQMTVGSILASRPSRSRVFEQHGIDYCCGGQQTLKQACAQNDLDTSTILAELAESDASHANVQEIDWTQQSITQLIDHLLETHHVYVKREIPRLRGLVGKIAEVHGENHPELLQLRQLFHHFAAEIESHLAKEEQVLFPFSKELDATDSLTEFHCGSLQNPIRVMVHEHEDAGEALREMRQLTSDYTTPEDGCNTYRATLDGLADLEKDMHWHIHKENNILFPAIVQAEAAQRV